MLTENISSTLLFNTSGDDKRENRKIWYGNTTNLMNLNNVKYNWAVGIYKQLRENFWVSSKVDLTTDVNCYQELTKDEKRAYNGVLSYLVFLDSIQVCNLPHVKNPITAPEIRICLSEQESQEALHSESYQYLIETVIPVEERNNIYEFWRTDKILEERCRYIAQIYQNYVDNPTPENYFTTLLADYILEGLYFFTGFILYYSFSSRSLMSGSADMFKYINRDELAHKRLFQKLIKEALTIFPYSEDMVYNMVDKAVQQEIRWNNHITNDKILGLSSNSTEIYVKYLGNNLLKSIGFQPLYTGEEYKKSPYFHLEKFADLKGEANTKSNFFESTVTSYNVSSAVNGWDNF